MANITQVYIAASAITCQLAPGGTGLASSFITGREGTAFDNSSATNPALDGSLDLAIKLGASAPTGDIQVGLTVTEDGTHYGSPATGSDQALTLPRAFDASLLVQAPNGIWYWPGTSIIYLGKIECYGQASGATVRKIFAGLAAACGGSLPKKFSCFVMNQTGSALDTTEANHTKQFIGKYAQSL